MVEEQESRFTNFLHFFHITDERDVEYAFRPGFAFFLQLMAQGFKERPRKGFAESEDWLRPSRQKFMIEGNGTGLPEIRLFLLEHTSRTGIHYSKNYKSTVLL